MRALLIGHARVFLALWVGAVAAIAFVSAPLVFDAVPEVIASKELAGRITGPGFFRVDVFGIVASLVAFAGVRAAGGSFWRSITLCLMGVCAAVDAFVIVPQIESRAEPVGTWHALAVGLWTTILVGGIVLLAFDVDPRRRETG